QLPPRRLRRVRQRGRRSQRELLAGLLLGDVQQRLEPPRRPEHRQRGLHVGPHLTGADREPRTDRGAPPPAAPPVAQPGPHAPAGPSTASAACTSGRTSPVRAGSPASPAVGNRWPNSPSTSKDHTSSKGTFPAKSSMSTPR